MSSGIVGPDNSPTKLTRKNFIMSPTLIVLLVANSFNDVSIAIKSVLVCCSKKSANASTLKFSLMLFILDKIVASYFSVA